MKSEKLSLNLAFWGIVISLGGCSGSTESEPLNSERNVVYVEEDITTPTTWSSENVYVIKSYDFWVESSLTIEPGVVVMFTHDGSGLYLSGEGLILAKGTESDPIIFTSIRDDKPAGDINGDGAVTKPQSGDWGTVDVGSEQNGSEFNYCRFYYGGGDTYPTALYVGGGKITVTNSVFAHNQGGPNGDFWYGALTLEGSAKDSRVAGNIFFDNGLPLVINANLNLDNSNIFHNPDSVTETNERNGIYTDLSDEITDDISWLETEVAFVIDDNDVWVQDNGSLSLGDSVVLKFTPESVIVLDMGASSMPNFDGPGVRFTSIKDDSIKGDTNGDHVATSASEGDWNGIYDGTAEIGEPDYFSWSQIEFDSH